MAQFNHPALAGQTAVTQAMPKRWLSRKVLTCVIVVLIVQPLLCIAAFQVLISQRSLPLQNDGAHAIGQMLANGLAEQIADGDIRHGNDLLDRLDASPMVAFACIFTREGVLRHASVFDNELWERFTKSNPEFAMSGRYASMSNDNWGLQTNLMVSTYPITVKPSRRASAAGVQSQPLTDKNTPALLVLGVRDYQMPQIMKSYYLSLLLTMTGIAGIFLPLVGILVHRWTSPMFTLLRAIRGLAAGEKPAPLVAKGRTEFDFLGNAFNQMAGKLLTAQHDLREANMNLEQKVQERTGELQEALVQLDRLASTDALTELANRRAFSDALTNSFQVARHADNDLVCIMIDLDGFKGVNDALGHDSGDAVIKFAAGAIKEAGGPGDFAARFGGDEFALLLTHASISDAQAIAEKMQDRFRESVAEMLAAKASHLKVSMSIGVASVKVHGAKSATELLRQADQALYEAKYSGKARVEVFHPSLAA